MWVSANALQSTISGILELNHIMKTLLQRIASLFSFQHLPYMLLAIPAVSFAVALYAYQLGSFIGLSPAETASAAANQSLGAVLADPVNLPYKLFDWLCLQLPFGPIELRARLASAVLALGSAGLLYLLARRWHDTHGAVLAALLFIPSGWLLHTGRFGSGLVMLTFMVLALTAAAAWLITDSPRGRTLLIYSFVATAALFVPAGIWFVLASALVLRKNLLRHAKAASRIQLAAAGTLITAALVSLLSIATGLAGNTDQIRLLLGIPLQIPELIVAAKQAAGSVSYLFFRGPYLPEVWLAHTPVLDAASTALFLFGVIAYSRYWSNIRVQLLLAFAFVSAALITLHGAAALSYLVPIVYLIITNGLIFFIRRWLAVFPRNPIAQSLAYSTAALILLSITTFHTQRYFIAWRNSPDTRQAYQSTGSTPPEALNLVQ